VRVLAALGEDITPFVGAKVAEYVATNDVYLHPLSQKVKGLLTASRWQHTVGVCLAAVKNCGQAKATEDSAFTAALLHDVAKYIPADSELLQGFVLPEGVPSPVVHQFAGAYVAEHAFGITDDDILNAIRYHTSGRAGMSALEKLIYLADMVEDGRNFPGVGEMRTLFYSDLDKCLQTVLCHQMDYLSNSGAIVYGLTRQAYDFYK
jgi:predicted HD superfamily hydrolase involved in NAD metabolism